MSDISINFTWGEILLFSPLVGWPGLMLGCVLGAILWRTRPGLGALLGAVIGNFAVFFFRLWVG